MARSKKTSKAPNTFVFRKHANVGAADAIDDLKFLSESFVDNGELDILCDNRQPQCIVVGRTGSGKTALLERLAIRQEKVIKIAPEGLALTYVSNNEVLNFFVTAGVNMELFYRLLWRHVFAVEIIREHYHIINEESRDSFLTRLRARIIKDKSRQDALEYLLKWGESFWKDSEYRVKEITETLERNLGASLTSSMSVNVPAFLSEKADLSADYAKTLSREERAEVIRRGQSVVDAVQMKTLSDVMDLLENDILDDKKRKYFITVDRLDENWVHDDLRYRLIRALLDTVRDFNNKIANVKIIIAIREDLLDRVFRYTRSAGYQEEKYKSMYLPLSWNEEQLEDMLTRRVTQLVREQYTSRTVGLRDLLPAKVGKQDAVEYLLERTMLRPRDMIMFFNECIRAAEGKPRILKTTLLQAEAAYSENRLRALVDEWLTDYPNLIELILFLKAFTKQFKFDDVRDVVEERMLNFLISSNSSYDFIHGLIEEKFESGDTDGFLKEMFKILFRVGVVGIKPDPSTGTLYSYKGQRLLGGEVPTSARIYVHPAFWRALGIRPIGDSQSIIA